MEFSVRRYFIVNVILFVLGLVCVPNKNTKAEETVKIEPTPAWAETLAIPKPNPSRLDQVRAGIYYLLTDEQVRPTENGFDHYQHIAYQITDRAGLEEAARIQNVFDPKNDQFAINYVHIIRSGMVIDRLAPNDILVIRRERRLEQGIFDGYLTALIELKDVQVGDVIDFATTRHRHTPLWPGQFFIQADTSWTVPLGVQRFKLFWPESRPLSVKPIKTDIAPIIVRQGNYKIYEWRREDPEPIPYEDSIPNGFRI